jgi:hypothetical protein
MGPHLKAVAILGMRENKTGQFQPAASVKEKKLKLAGLADSKQQHALDGFETSNPSYWKASCGTSG